MKQRTTPGSWELLRTLNTLAVSPARRLVNESLHRQQRSRATYLSLPTPRPPYFSAHLFVRLNYVF